MPESLVFIAKLEDLLHLLRVWTDL